MSETYNEVLRAASVLFQVGDVVEVRVPNAGRQRTISGYFSDLQKLARVVEQLERAKHPGVYWTLNPVRPDLRARADHKAVPFAKYTTGDVDIVRRRWLPVDFDPERPAGISSTDAEKQAALEVMRRAHVELAADGWPEPVQADSGNGWHLLYPIALPNDAESAELLQHVLEGMHARFGTPAVSVDRKNFNASRIFKAYGTTARKGDNTADRPHRLARVLEVPEQLVTVSVDLLHRVAAAAPAKARPAGVRPVAPRSPRSTPFDIEDFLGRHGIRYRGPASWNGGRKWVLEECPFNPAHKDPDAAVFELADGAFGFTCLHNSCHGLTWRDFREHYEPDAPRGQRPSAPPLPEEPPDLRPPETTSPADDRSDEVPLSVVDVEAAVDAAPDVAAALRLLPEIARVPAHVQALIKAKLRGRFKAGFSARDFDKAVKELAEQQNARPPEPPDDDDGTSADAPDLTGYPLTDSGNAERIVALFGRDIRFCVEFDKWLLWKGSRWQVDDAEEITQWVMEMARLLYKQARGKALQPELQTHARASESQAAIMAALRRAASRPGIPIHAADLDQHKYLLNCLNGVVDLRTGELLPPDRKYLITKLCRTKYAPDAPAPKMFLRFLWWAMGASWEAAQNDDAELPERTTRLVSFMQRAFGYALTADVGEKAAFVFYGRKGNNGKTTLLTIITSLLADYSTKLDINTLLQGKATDNNVRADLARLHGVRLAMTTELDDQQRLSERLFKELAAGMGDITACRKFENPFQFPATHKIFVDGNHRPVIRGTDDAIWQRLRCVPFDSHLDDDDPRIDRKLKDKILAHEAEGVLAWLVRGSARWAKEGLGVPIDVKEANEQWRRSDDPLREFLDECCEAGAPADGFWIQRKHLAAAYRAWCKENGENFPLSRKHFTERVENKGFKENRSRRDELTGKQMRTWEGIRLNPDVTLPAMSRFKDDD